MSLKITKTPKCYVGGAFIRSESGRVYEIHRSSGEFFANIPRCTRKDVRNAVEAAAKAGAGWAKRTPYNRAQILYRLAEMLEARAPEMSAALALHGTTSDAAAKEVRATIDRIVHFAGWADKYEQVLGSVNPVASPHFNFTVTEPMGIVGILAPENAPLLALMTLILPAITAGNSVVAGAGARKARHLQIWGARRGCVRRGGGWEERPQSHAAHLRCGQQGVDRGLPDDRCGWQRHLDDRRARGRVREARNVDAAR